MASGATDVVVAVIASSSTLIGASLALYGVVYTVNRQKRPKIVDLDHDSAHRELAQERDRRITAEIERDVWKQIVLEREK